MNNINWQDWRDEFPGLEENTYLNTVSLGQLSRRSRKAVHRFLDLWSELGASAWYHIWLKEIEGVRREFAQVIGASPEEIAIMSNVSSALTAVASCLNYEKRSKVVCNELDFPTIPYQWYVKKDQGVETVVLPSENKVSVPLEAYESAVDENTNLIATCRVFFTSGYIQDVKRLADMAHDQGALLFVDDYQGTGQVPIDVKETGVDFLVSGGLKWLLGGPGIAFLYIRKELIPTLHPTSTGWFAHRHQFDFDPHELELRNTGARLETGTPSVASAYAAKAGLEIVNEISPEAIRERTHSLNQDLIERLQGAGFKLRIPEDPNHHASITIMEMNHNPAEVVEKLAQRNIIVDKRPGAIRIAPYFYNTFEENELIVSALKELTPA